MQLKIEYIPLGKLTPYEKNARLHTEVDLATIRNSIEQFGMCDPIGVATDILSEVYGGKDARKAVWVGFFTSIASTVIIQTSMLFVPNSEDFVSSAMATVFGLLPRLCVASLIAYLVSNMLDTYLYDVFKKRLPKHLWLRNNAATMISQLVDNVIFTAIAWIGVFDLPTMIELGITSQVIKCVISLCDTPFLYLAKRIKPQE